MTNQFRYFVLIFLAVFAVACRSHKKATTPRNLERIYDPASSSVHPQLKVYNTSDTSSLLVERVYTKELLFNQANPENKLLARIKVIYYLYDIDDKQNLVDSATTTFSFKKNTGVLYQTIEIPVNALISHNYILEVITTDLNRNNNQYSFLNIDRSKINSWQDFLLYNSNDELLVNPYIMGKKEIRVEHYKKKLDSLNVFFIPNNFSVPNPPYMEDSIKDDLEKYDSTWVCYSDSVNYSSFQKEGIYFFTTSSDLDFKPGGFALYNFGEGYPVVRTPKQLAKPTVYLGGTDTVSEADSTGKFTKLAVDNFWLAKTNNIDKSRDLLKLYYNRVMFANTYFTSYMEGWQTDRGMIYIIYGLPDYLFKAGGEERWIYNPNGIGTGIVFTFKHIKHPLTFNHYRLEREKLKTTGWDEAVKMWNTGEIFYFQN